MGCLASMRSNRIVVFCLLVNAGLIQCDVQSKFLRPLAKNQSEASPRTLSSSAGVMSAWEENADITKSICGFFSTDVGGINSSAKNKYIEQFAYCANDVHLWSAEQCGRCYEVRAVDPNTAAQNPDVQPKKPIISKVVQIIDKNDFAGRHFDCNENVFEELTGHRTDLFSIEWTPVDCDVEQGAQEFLLFNAIVDPSSNKLGTINALFFNQKTSVVSVTMRAFKRCGDPPNPITCYEENVYTMKRNGDGAIWANPSLADGVVKPISFQVTFLNGETKTYQEQDWIQQQGFDPLSAVWAPAAGSTATTTSVPGPLTTTIATTTQATDTTTVLQVSTAAPGSSCNTCNTCVAIPGNPHAATDVHCSPCAMDGQSWWPCDVDGLCQCGGGPDPITTTIATTTETSTITTTIATTTETSTMTATIQVTTAAPSSSCKTCSTCVAIPGNPHAATDVHCSPCAMDGQAWWPCDVDGLCQCA